MTIKCMFGTCKETATETRYAKVFQDTLMHMNKVYLCFECAEVCDYRWDDIFDTTKGDPYELYGEGFELNWYTGEEL